MAIFKRSTAQKLEKSLADLRERETALALKRSNAQTLFDEAVSERQSFLLSGDLADDARVVKLQSRVDSCASQIAGIDAALGALAQQIDDIERTLLAEREQIERQAASERLSREVAEAEAALPQWLESSRKLHSALMQISVRSFELDQASSFLLNTCVAQLEIALGISLAEMRGTVSSIKAGTAPLPRVVAEVVQLPQPTGPTPTSPGEEVELWFAVRPLKYRDLNGQQRVIVRWSDVELPKRLVARATQRDAVVPITDERRKSHRGLLNGLTTTPDHAFVDLDAAEIKPASVTGDLPEGFERLPGLPA
jgi:hypothetical protein